MLANSKTVVVCMLALAVGGCEEREAESEPIKANAQRVGAQTETPGGDDAFAARAKKLTQQFQSALQSALSSAIQQGGPPNAIAVCSKQAPAIGRKVSNNALSIRRIGTRVRNPDNAPTDAERQKLAALSPETPEQVYASDGQKTYMRAIFVNKPVCLKCHGPRESLSQGVRQKLAELYPQDNATGYALGDLRGAFIVEAAPQ